MLNLVGLTRKHKDVCQRLWDMATKMENLATKISKDSPFCHFYQHDTLFLNSLHVFGEIAVVQCTEAAQQAG